MNKTAPSPGRIAAMVIFAISCFGLLLFLWLSFGGPVPLKPKGYRVEVGFKEATQLALEADVRASGVSIGKVREKRVDETEGGRTVATIEIERKYAPLPVDTRAVLRQKTLLGETYVELTLGTRTGAMLEEGGRLPNHQVQPTVELDEILDTLDEHTRLAFRTWQRAGGAAVRGRGRDLNDAFGTLPQFVASGGDLVELLDNQRGALQGLVRNTGAVFQAITAREGQLSTLIGASDDVFSAIATERESLADSFQILPTFMDESRATFDRLDRFSRATEPLLRDMRPALDDLGPALRSLGDLGPDLRRFFRDLDPLIDISRRSLPATREVLDGLGPVFVELAPFLAQVNPILDYIGLHVYTLSDMFANLGVATAATVSQPSPGSTGHYLRQFGPLGLETLALHQNRLATNRGNAYPGPLGVLAGPEGAKYKVLPAWDCNNAGGERLPDDEPGCRVAKPPPGLSQQFPHLSAADYSRPR